MAVVVEGYGGLLCMRNISFSLQQSVQEVSTYVELGVLAGALLESVLVGFTAGVGSGALGAGVDARRAERASCAESGASDD